MPTILSYAIYESITHKETASAQTPEETHIFKKTEPFLEKMGIRKDLKIKEKNGLFESVGNNSFPSADAVIYIDRNLYRIDPNACSFVLKHEISHIKHNDRCSACALAFIATLTALFLTSSCNESLSADIVAFTGAITLFSAMCYQERKADDFAIRHSSIDELEGGIRLFKAIQKRYLEVRENSDLAKWLISSNGENRLDLMHPSLAHRIKKIEAQLKTSRLAKNIY
jgi:Zn-dependent protease with chaperone function